MSLQDGTTPGTSNRRPGRPRNSEIDAELLRATSELLAEQWPVTVSDVVERTGVSKGAIYRRFGSFNELLATALDQGRTPITVPTDLPLREALVAIYLGTNIATLEEEQRRIRRRLLLVLEDPALQAHYWRGHVQRRRVPVAGVLQQGIASGELRPDLDIEATMDLFSGVSYYQLTARGASLTSPDTRARLMAAVDIIWRGIAVPAAQ